MSGSELRSFLPAVKSSVASIPWMAAFHDPPPKPHISRGSCHTDKTLTKKAESGQMGAMTEDTDISSINIFSIGYEGKPIGAFIAMLKQNGVVRLIDVRQAPYSRKPGFSKKPLEEALQAAGIDYVGIPELGTDKASRDAHKSDENIAPILKEYQAKFEKNFSHYGHLKTLAQEKPSAIMCYEEDYRQCHRQFIEERLEADGFKVIHLGGDPQTALKIIE
jgi:hypothetical protein